jgi:hypothetical protein
VRTNTEVELGNKEIKAGLTVGTQRDITIYFPIAFVCSAVEKEFYCCRLI